MYKKVIFQVIKVHSIMVNFLTLHSKYDLKILLRFYMKMKQYTYFWAWMTLFGFMLLGWQRSAKCSQGDTARLHVVRVTLLDYMWPGWHCSITCCQDNTNRLHVARMTLLYYMLSGWHCSVTCFQDDTTELHVARMKLQCCMLSGWNF